METQLLIILELMLLLQANEEIEGTIEDEKVEEVMNEEITRFKKLAGLI